MTAERRPSRRDQQRQSLLTDIHTEAHRQIAVGGVPAVSMSGIAQSLGMSPAALYRYFSSRDDLVRAVIRATFEAYVAVVEESMYQTEGRPAPERLRRLLGDCRRWALDHPTQYTIISWSLHPGQEVDPDELVAPSLRPFHTMCSLLAQIDERPANPPHPVEEALTAKLADQLTQQGPGEFPAEVVIRAMVLWSRMHGAISLELLGVYDRSGIDPDTFFALEVSQMLRLR
jgi:AcrR family transcriptional regulator